MIAIYDVSTGALEQVVSSTDGHDLTGKGTIAAPDEWHNTHEWDEATQAFAVGRFKQARRSAKAEINRRAEEVYSRHSKGGVIGAVLEPAKFVEAISYLSAATPDEKQFPLLEAEVGVTGVSLRDVAQVIEAKPREAEAALKTVSLLVEPFRVAACKAVEGAGSQNEISQILRDLTFPEV